MVNESWERVIVTVDDDHVHEIQSVAEALRQAGMQITNVLHSSGIITGRLAQSQRQAIERIPGIAALEPDRDMWAT